MKSFNIFDNFRKFKPIPVTRPNSPHRNNTLVSAGYVTHGAVKLIFSKDFFTKYGDSVGHVGSYVLLGYRDGVLAMVASEQGEPNARKISKHVTMQGGGYLVISSHGLPKDFPKWEGRYALKCAETIDGEEEKQEGVLFLHLPEIITGQTAQTETDF